MAKKLDIEFIDQGFRDVLLAPGTFDVCEAAGKRIAQDAGEGFSVVRGTKSKVRAHVWVRADTYEARLAEAEYSALSSAVH